MEKQALIEFLERNATIKFEAEEEDVPVRGNAMASGDDDYDRKIENELLEQLERGNLNAWFCAKVTATYDNFHGVDYLGCCSWDSFEAFQKDAYYDSMVSQAIENLADEILQRKFDLDKIEGMVSNEA